MQVSAARFNSEKPGRCLICLWGVTLIIYHQSLIRKLVFVVNTEPCMHSSVNTHCGVAQSRYWRSPMQHRLTGGTIVPG